jgi:hypothetical protein
VVVLSRKVPVRGCIFKERVKVCTLKSPTFSDDFASDFAAFYVFPDGSCAETQHFCSLEQGEQAISNRRYRVGFWTSCALSLRLSFRLPAFEPLPVFFAALRRVNLPGIA